MAYRLTGITLETDTSEESMKQLEEVWQDILSGRIPLMHDSAGTFQEGLSPITEFRGMSLDGKKAYPINIRTVDASFFKDLQKDTESGKYRLYEGADDNDIGPASNTAWQAVIDDAAAGVLDGSSLAGYESTVPAEYTPDHKARCFVYVRTEE